MSTIYVRTLKHAEHTVFCVEDGQKTYFDPQFGRYVPYSSGQQIKRSLIDKLSSVLEQVPAPTTFIFDKSKEGELKEGEVYATCDPSYPDQLFGGWMKAGKGGKTRTIKRRSPLSISAMRGLHPLLSGIKSEDISFDRSERSNTVHIVRDEKGNPLNVDEVMELLKDTNRSLSRKWIPSNKRATGLFVQDIAIDLRRLFTVSLNDFEPELEKTEEQDTEKTLRDAGWKESRNIFGKCLVAPEKERERLIPALAESIIEWTITSNQSRTFSLMETLAISIGENGNKIASSIRAKLSEDDENKAVPVIEEELDGIETFISTAASGYIRTKSESVNALEKAKEKLIEKMTSFDYENQLS